MAVLIYSFRSEWLKIKRSLAFWLVIVGAVFTPSIVTLIHILRPEKVPAQFAAQDFWIGYYKNAWQSMVSLLLPMGIILAVTLATQLEYKNNSWKQLHTTPQSLTAIYLNKFLVLIALQLQLFVLFNIAVYLSAAATAAALPAVTFPTESFPWQAVLVKSGYYFIDSLPIVALQYLLSLVFRNFLVAVGTGLILLVTTLVMLSWEHAYVFPYSYGIMDYLGRFPDRNLHTLALAWFVFTFMGAYILYRIKPDKA